MPIANVRPFGLNLRSEMGILEQNELLKGRLTGIFEFILVPEIVDTWTVHFLQNAHLCLRSLVWPNAYSLIIMPDLVDQSLRPNSSEHANNAPHGVQSSWVHRAVWRIDQTRAPLSMSHIWHFLSSPQLASLHSIGDHLRALTGPLCDNTRIDLIPPASHSRTVPSNDDEASWWWDRESEQKSGESTTTIESPRASLSLAPRHTRDLGCVLEKPLKQREWERKSSTVWRLFFYSI